MKTLEKLGQLGFVDTEYLDLHAQKKHFKVVYV